MAIVDDVAPPVERPPERRKLPGFALATSLAVHAALALALLSSASGRPVGADGPGADHGVMSVTLVNRRAASDPLPQDAAATRLRPLLAKLDNGLTPELSVAAPKPASRFDRLFAQLKQRQPAEQARSTPSSQDRSARNLEDGADERAEKAAGHERSGRATADQPGAGAGLWGLVSPCWDRLGGSSRVPVTLEVGLDGQGRISKPPRIVRAASETADEPRLRAEAMALAALAACAPQSDWRLANRTYRLEFTPRS